jgi:hypothetical protein
LHECLGSAAGNSQAVSSQAVYRRHINRELYKTVTAAITTMSI